MTVTYRTVKGTALTYGEVDENFRDLLEDTTIDRVLGNGNTTTKDLTIGNLNAGIVNASSALFSGVATTALRITNPAVPGSPTATGIKGQIAYDNSYVYICVATNTWRRAELLSW